MRDLLELTDPAALRALAHPLRVRLLGLLREHGPGTATTLARALGETSGDTSYHLRQLARYGLVEEVIAEAKGRQRWWQAAALRFRASADAHADPEMRITTRLLRDRILERDARILNEFLASEAESSDDPPSLFSNEVLFLVDDELDEVGQKLLEALQPYLRRNPAERPEGARRIHLAIHAVPWERF